jgi:hypothetical protein
MPALQGVNSSVRNVSNSFDCMKKDKITVVTEDCILQECLREGQKSP